MSKKNIEKFFSFIDYTFSKKYLYAIPNNDIEKNTENSNLNFLPKNSIYLELNKLIKYFQFIPNEKKKINDDINIGFYLNKENINFIKYSITMIKKGEINESI